MFTLLKNIKALLIFFFILLMSSNEVCSQPKEILNTGNIFSIKDENLELKEKIYQLSLLIQI